MRSSRPGKKKVVSFLEGRRLSKTGVKKDESFALNKELRKGRNAAITSFLKKEKKGELLVGELGVYEMRGKKRATFPR